MTWTTEVPKKVGFYWYYSLIDNYGLLELISNEEFYFFGDEKEFKKKEIKKLKLKFYGPIEPPKEGE